jgi:uncharacterized membrane protein (UPF0127 family)
MHLKIYIYILITLIAVVSLSIMTYYNSNPDHTDTGSRGAERTSGEISWNIICLRINGVNAVLYLADTLSKQVEGYMYKNSTDFLGVGAVGMLFNISAQPGAKIAFTMRNVAFALYLLHITHIEGVGDIVIDVIYMEPGKEPYTVTVRSLHDYFIELSVDFYKTYIASRSGWDRTPIRITGTC